MAALAQVPEKLAHPVNAHQELTHPAHGVGQFEMIVSGR